MKYIKTLEKYTHTKQDKIDDVISIREFTSKFEEQFEDRLNIDEKYDIEVNSDYGAHRDYFGETTITPNRFKKTKKKIKYYINIDTDINPNGITGDNDIGRTFTIKFKIKTKSKIPDFYGYSRDIDSILERFDEYVTYQLNIKHLSEIEKAKKKFLRTQKKYNL